MMKTLYLIQHIKGRTNLLTLFADNNDIESIPEFFMKEVKNIQYIYKAHL